MHPAIELCYAIQAEVSATIEKIQASCEHPPETLFKVYGANTGNYDPSSDCYWADFKCYQCGKFWNVRYDKNGDNDDYRMRGREVKKFPKSLDVKDVAKVEK